MTVTTISRVFFHWYEYQAMLKFESENPTYKKISEDTTGITYEHRADYVLDMAERKEELDCNDCYYSMQNCHDRSVCCEDETALCDNFEPVVE